MKTSTKKSDSTEENVCVTCSTPGECEDVFMLAFEDTQFSNIFYSFMGFELSEKSKLKYMCLECINTIISYHTFKKAALKSYEELSKKETEIEINIAKEAKQQEKNSEQNEHIVLVSIEDANLIDVDDNETDSDDERTVESKQPDDIDPEANSSDQDTIEDQPEIQIEFADIKQEEDFSFDEGESEETPLKSVKKEEPNKLSAKKLKENNQWQCSYCYVIISKNDPAAIKKHRYQEKVKRIKIHECPVCHKKYTKTVIQEHILRHGENKPVVCTICKKGVSSRQTLKQHMMLHDGMKYTCDVCQKGFTQSFLLKEHMHTHDKDGTFLCPTCGMSFPNPTRLRQHLYVHKPKTKQRKDQHRHICDFCGKSFSSAKTLEVHRAKHESDERFECARCGKAFGHRALLTSHLWLHMAQFRCQKCFKIYQKDELQKHDCVPLPEGEIFDDFLPTECRKCGEILQHGMLNRHMRRHDARECKICGQRFFTARKFQFHLNRHNLKCELCGKGFSKKDSYLLHTVNKVCVRVNSNYIKRLAFK